MNFLEWADFSHLAIKISGQLFNNKGANGTCLEASFLNFKKIIMDLKGLSQLTDGELLQASKDNKPSPLIDAFFIGFLVGIIVFSVAANTWGLVTIVPLVLIYAFLKKPKRYAALKEELRKRNLES